MAVEATPAARAVKTGRIPARTTALLALLAVLALPGCFGSDDDEPAPSGRESSGPSDTGGGAQSIGGASGGSSALAGGTSGAGATVEPAATRAELIRRADRVCGSAQARVRDTSEDLSRLLRSLGRKRLTSREYYARSATLTEQAQLAVLDALETLRALGRPPGRQDSLDRYLAATGRHAAVTGGIAEALRERRRAELARLNRRWLELSEAAHNAARAYGFDVCGGN